MRCRLHRFALTKAVPLTISRGTTTAVEHLLFQVEHEGLTGLGESGGFDTGHRHYDTDAIASELAALIPALEARDPEPRQALEPLLATLSPPARCAVDLALLDWWGQRLARPVGQLWGLDCSVAVPTSVTLGLGTVPQVLERLRRWWQVCPASRVKLKLGSPEGVEHDQALVRAVNDALRERWQTTGQEAELQVDANGGWDLTEARRMVHWLAQAGVVLVEQPLPPLLDPEDDTAAFAALDLECPIPLVADESCWSLADLLRLAPHVDGVNIKLLKSGGLSEAHLMAQVARRLGLDVMVGCYSDSALLNGAACQLLPLVRWPDLDSHLNLLDDPFDGPRLEGDDLHASVTAGLGVKVRQDTSLAHRLRARQEPFGEAASDAPR
jgi:L-alanine-DL-glutamate epimerase-like enolase superfamily enzyme